MPIRMRSETARWCRTSVQQAPQQPQQQPKILYNLLMQPEARNDPVQANGSSYGTSNHYLMPSDASHQFPGSGDFLVPVGRPRSRSMGAQGWRMPDVMSGVVNPASRTPSRDSLASYDESIGSDESAARWSSSGGRAADLLLEDARSKLMHLSTKSDGSPSHYESDIDTRSLSQPGSPHTPIQAFRKYSEGSQLRSRFQHLRTAGHRSAAYSTGSDHPVDLSCKRKKFECTPGMPYPRRATFSHHVASNVSLDEGIDDDSSSERSILKSNLTGRVRSNSMSVCGNRHTTGELGDGGSKLNPRQHVTLAKKNLLPVKARITDLLNKSIDFACQLQCFTALPIADQRSLLVNAAPRLLLLEMARSNVQFAVTPVHGSGSQLAEEGEMASAAGDVTGKDNQSSSSQDSTEMPTQQFVESVQNFVKKCQMFGISTEEYFYMRMIALFQLGTSLFTSLNSSSFQSNCRILQAHQFL